ncbi:venom serine protease Bi-VSP isoform X2 [Condylostylus longicornis]|uniref:venom serine protease Bi-VSP isoform X2 n=1 Tax=Condylostylus longicornis TaxID=2530218 RepID=UPI00244DE71C|nr:venom serine protease Bi-VSP isoform X2 [Condylostylus longicornis]
MTQLIKIYLSLFLIYSANCSVRDKRQAQYCVTPDNYQGYCTPLTDCQQVALLYAQNGGSNSIRQYLFGLRNACNNIVLRGDPVVCCSKAGSPSTNNRPNQNVVTTTRPEFNKIRDSQNSLRSCYTPENYQGYCTTLSQCQYLRSLYLQYGGSNQFRQYFAGSRNACNNVAVGGDPVVCCNQSSGSQTETTQRPTPSIVTPTSSATTVSSNSCRGPDGVTGTCENLRNCPPLLSRLEQNPNDIEYAQFLRDSNTVCGLPAPVICCPKTGTTPVTNAPQISGNNIIVDRLPTTDEGCGIVGGQFFKKVVGGQPAKPGDWPWIALLGYREPDGQNAFKCGGALITSRHILTAAHCIRSNLNIVRLGENDLSKETETEYVDIPVQKTYVHPKYDRRDGHSDIAVLRLNQNAPYTNFIRYACLPYETSLRTKSYVDLNPFVAGWGKTQEDGKSAQVLQEIQIPVHRNAECISRYSAENRYISDKQFDDSVLCAGVLAGGKDTCQGDSGGPLVQPEPSTKDKGKLFYYVIGVVSYGIGCARPNIPGVYTNVPKFIDWIQQQIKDTT